MKSFKKDINDNFVCEECGKTFKYKKGLAKHINNNHVNVKYYYDKYIKEDLDDICKNDKCNNKTNFTIFARGYKNVCSKECGYKYTQQQQVKSNMKKYGVDNISKLNNIKKKKEETCIKNNNLKAGFADIKKRNKTKLKLYNNVNFNNRFKSEKTCLRKYGVKNPSQLVDVKKKKEETCFKNHGVKHPSQCPKIFLKQQISSLKSKQYKNTNLYYRSSYEKEFLDLYYDKFPDIQNGFGIEYYIYDKKRMYIPDFYIPSLNLIIEIKSINTIKYYQSEKEISEKEKAVITVGYKYVLILDKDYCFFNNLITK